MPVSRYHEASNARYNAEEVLHAFAKQLIADEAHLHEWMDAGGASVYHVLFGGADHADPVWRDAFNHGRRLPEYATYLAQEMNDSMFDDSFGDVSERSGPSFMCSAFANMMADRVLRLLGEDYAQQVAKTRQFDAEHERVAEADTRKWEGGSLPEGGA